MIFLDHRLRLKKKYRLEGRKEFIFMISQKKLQKSPKLQEKNKLTILIERPENKKKKKISLSVYSQHTKIPRSHSTIPKLIYISEKQPTNTMNKTIKLSNNTKSREKKCV